MNVKRIIATEWMVAIIVLPGGVLMASVFTAFVNPYDLTAPFAFNLGRAMRTLFVTYPEGTSWGLALAPYILLQVVRLTRWAIYTRNEPL